MTTVTNTDLPVVPTPIQIIGRHAESSGKIKTAALLKDTLTILQYSPTFADITGPEPNHTLLLSTTNNSNNPFFHEACVFLPGHDELYITSNLLQSSTSSTYPTILISRLKLSRSESQGGEITKVEWAKLRPPPGIEMPNGGVNYKDGILFCAQGGPSQGSGGIWYMPRSSPPVPVCTGWYGRDFNSVNDIVVSKWDGGIWFTDPCYGYEQGFRRRPELPNQVYRFDVKTGECRIAATEFDRPNGLCFSPDEKTMYITDTGFIHGDGGKDFTRPATIYAFDVVNGKELRGRRTFAFARVGVPDGIKCDMQGNVYSGCGDGVEVWNPDGELIGVIGVPGGVANFCFGRDGEMFVCNEQRLWRVKLGGGVVGALLG